MDTHIINKLKRKSPVKYNTDEERKVGQKAYDILYRSINKDVIKNYHKKHSSIEEVKIRDKENHRLYYLANKERIKNRDIEKNKNKNKISCGKYIRTQKQKDDQSKFMKTRWESLEYKEEMGNMLKGLWNDERKEEQSNKSKKQWAEGKYDDCHSTPEARENHSIATKKAHRRDVYNTTKCKETQSKTMKTVWASGVMDDIHNTPEARKKASDITKKNHVLGKYSKSETTEKHRLNIKKRLEKGDFSTPKFKEEHRKISKDLWASGRMDSVFSGETSIEISLYKFLEENNIPFTKKKTINIGYRTRKPDAFIEPNIVLEADGTYHHSENCHGKNTKDADIKADLIMKEMGYIIYRIPEPDFRNGKYIETLQQIIKEHKISPIKNDFGCV